MKSTRRKNSLARVVQQKWYKQSSRDKRIGEAGVTLYFLISEKKGMEEKDGIEKGCETAVRMKQKR